MSRSPDMIVNNNYHNIACKSSDIKKSKNKNGFLNEREENNNNNDKSCGYMSKNKKSFAHSITQESPLPSLSIIETHYEERTRNGSLPLCDLYARNEDRKNDSEKNNPSRQDDVSKKTNVKSGSKYEEEEQESPSDLKNKNGFRSSFKKKYLNGFNRSKRKSKKAAKKEKLEEFVDSDVSLSAAESEPPYEDISLDTEVPVQISNEITDYPGRSGSFSVNENKNTERKMSENSIRVNLKYLSRGRFNKNILIIVKKYRGTNVTDLLKCKCLEKNLFDFYKYINDLNVDEMTNDCRTTSEKFDCGSMHTIVNRIEPTTAVPKVLPPDKCSMKIEETAQSTIESDFSSPSKSEHKTVHADLIDTTSLKVKDVIQLFESAAQKSLNDRLSTHKRESSTISRNKCGEPSPSAISKDVAQKPIEITNKIIVDKKTFFQRLSSWPLLKPRNKVVRRATPMKTLNQLRQHLTHDDSDIDSIADSEKDAEEDVDDESDFTTGSIETEDREDCESIMSQTSVTYCQKVQLKSFDHIIQGIEFKHQVSATFLYKKINSIEFILT